MSTTIKAMKRVQEIRAKRERVFFKNRMAGKKEQERADDIRQLEQNIELAPLEAKKRYQAAKVEQEKVQAMDMEE
jgi:large subunit ribosomal protein L24e